MALNRYKKLGSLINRQKAATAFFIVFYLVGEIGMVLTCTFSLFVKLIPLALILSFVSVAFFHVSKIDWKTILVFLSIYIFAFTIEAIGVNTGIIFGHYQYGEGLGLKLFQTPLIIGINWLFLVYTTAVIVRKFNIPEFAKILLASAGMLLYDIVLEQVAAKLDMWHWENDIIPFQNYLAWFVLAALFHFMLKVLKVRIENKLAFLILGCQFLFFLFLFISFKLIP